MGCHTNKEEIDFLFHVLHGSHFEWVCELGWKGIFHLIQTLKRLELAKQGLHLLNNRCCAPAESPADHQRGVQRFAWLEAGEAEESQRTFLRGVETAS